MKKILLQTFLSLFLFASQTVLLATLAAEGFSNPGVKKVQAGTAITLSPLDGMGEVTITGTGANSVDVAKSTADALLNASNTNYFNLSGSTQNKSGGLTVGGEGKFGNIRMGSGTVQGRDTGLHLASTGDMIVMEEIDAAANNKTWLIKMGGGDIELLPVSDAWDSFPLALKLHRTDTTFNSVELAGYLDFFNINSAQARTFAPRVAGSTIYNSDLGEICVATGTAAGQWKKMTGGGCH